MEFTQKPGVFEAFSMHFGRFRHEFKWPGARMGVRMTFWNDETLAPRLKPIF